MSNVQFKWYIAQSFLYSKHALMIMQFTARGFATWSPGDKGTFQVSQFGVVAKYNVYARVNYWLCGGNTNVRDCQLQSFKDC